MKKGNSERPSPDLARELAALEVMPDDTIDTSDIPEAADWTDARRGQFYKPRKVQKTMRIDADVLAWFESQGPGHLTRMNDALRSVMLNDVRRKGEDGAA